MRPVCPPLAALLFLCSVHSAHAADPPEPLDLLARARESAEAALALASGTRMGPPERLALAEQLLDAGLAGKAEGLLDTETDGIAGETDGLALRYRCNVARGEYALAAGLSDALERRAADSPRASLAFVDSLLLRGDLKGASRHVKTSPKGAPVTLLSRALLASRLHDAGKASELFQLALEAGAPARRCLLGLSITAQDQKRVDDALALVTRAAREHGVDADLLLHWGRLLVRSGEASEAVRVFEAVAAAYPWNGGAHYQLGNGYARRNYSELERDSPSAFPLRSAQGAPDTHHDYRKASDALMEDFSQGRFAEAATALEAMTERWPSACEPPTMLASMAWVRGDDRAAERWCRVALEREPAHGRAHAVLAKALASRKSALDVNRADDERAFASSAFPEVPSIEAFVLNWNSLSERHAKRIALSLEPFARYIPVLVAGGQTFYVKQLHERLSECPGHESLRDERISYDARLWDDVRGCGGNDTVIGIEDVENSIFGGSDTALHELAHQVHAVLDEDASDRIEQGYTQALARDASGGSAFVNRYQASSVWEYFAEGVHSYETPRRDRWDTRRALRHRLRERDPELVRIVRGILNERRPERFLASALATRAWNEVHYGRLQEGRQHLEHARAEDPEHEAVLTADVWFTLYEGDASAALEKATAGRTRHPASAGMALVAAVAEVHSRGDRKAALALLREALPQVDPGRRQDIEAAIAGLLFDDAEYAAAEQAYLAILERREDEPAALQGLLNAVMMQPPRTDDNLSDVLTRLVRKRSGVRSVRADAALALASRGDFAAARDQVREGLLNAPDSDLVLAAAACVELWAGAPHEAEALAGKALVLSGGADSGWNDLALLVRALASATTRPSRARADFQQLEARHASGPSFLFIESENEWRSVHGFGPLERLLMDRLESMLANAGADS